MKTHETRIFRNYAALILSLLLLLVMPAVVQAQFMFTTNNDGSLNIYQYTGSGGAVSIPGTTNGLQVTSIGAAAFYGCTGLTSVTIPNTVTSIGLGAFLYCSKLTSATIGTNVTSIGIEAFCYCSSLTSITVAALNPAYSSVDGVLFDKSQTTLIQYPVGKTGAYTIPNTVASIGELAFGTCLSLTCVTMPNSVTNIGDDAFAQCTSLTNVTIGTNVTIIGTNAFSFCTSLTNITIPGSVISIESQAFSYCTSLTNITVAALNFAYSSAAGVLFDKSQTTLIQFPCGKAGAYTVPDSVTNIGGGAFIDCDLTSITIPKGVASIGDEAFEQCTSLTNITIPDSVITIGSWAFAYCTNLISVTIGTNVTCIEDEAFDQCSSLTTVTIPNSVTNIGSYAFEECTKLTGVYFQGNAPGPANDTSVFDADNNPTAYYLAGSTGWTATFDGILTALWTPPALGITTVSSLPVVVWPASATNYVLQMTTNLTSGNWVTVTNGILFNAVQITNAPGTAFFRLQ
jgi:hypothetical protein